MALASAKRTWQLQSCHDIVDTEEIEISLFKTEFRNNLNNFMPYEC